jgi:pimeloyl-ACP methyl ester carboxylesterase
MTLIE